MRYAHTNIVAKDWQSLVDFYIEVFDCKLVPPLRKQSGEWLEKGTGVPNASLQGAHLLLPGHGTTGPTLEIYQYDSVIDRELPFANTTGFGHLAFEVENVEEILSKILSKGGSALGDITIQSVKGVGTITFVYTRDPEGNILEIQNWEKS